MAGKSGGGGDKVARRDGQETKRTYNSKKNKSTLKGLLHPVHINAQVARGKRVQGAQNSNQEAQNSNRPSRNWRPEDKGEQS
jgi:hypothetical protein